MADKLWLALAAWGAGMLVAVLGWLDSGESFNPRSFTASSIRSLIAGIIWAAAYPLDKPLSWEIIIGAIASGPFFDTVVNRVGSLLGNSKFPLTEEKQNTSLHQPPSTPAGGAPA